jgi:replicative DNA helicase
LSLVVVDHVGLLRPTGKARNSYESATEIAKELKNLATSLKLPILALCQLNRDGEGEIPKLSMLRDSGAIEENADKVWFIHRERGKSPTDFLIAKYRNGAVGSTESEDLVFDADRCSFQDANSAVHQDFKAWSN